VLNPAQFKDAQFIAIAIEPAVLVDFQLSQRVEKRYICYEEMAVVRCLDWMLRK
jgi:hypothetical protein